MRLLAAPSTTCLFIAFLLTATSSASAQIRTSVFTGTVTAGMTEEPLAGAIVYLSGVPVTETDAGGTFRLGGLPSGTVMFQIRRLGFRPLEVEVDMLPGEFIRLQRGTLAMDPIPVELDPALVTGVERRPLSAMSRLELAGFHERRQAGFGAFVDRAKIEEWSPRMVTDVLRRMPGVRVVPNKARGGRSDPYSLVDTRAYLVTLRGGCEPTIYLDGLYLGNSRDFDINLLIPASMVDGIEVYRGPSEVPSLFRTGGRDCGAIAFWMR